MNKVAPASKIEFMKMRIDPPAGHCVADMWRVGNGAKVSRLIWLNVKNISIY
jgi:hypothetical protein